MFSFEEKGVLLIGGGRNIGREIAREFARRGARVAVADIDTAAANETAQIINTSGGQAVGIGCDVTSEQSISEAVVLAEKFLGVIDVLMNNTGILHSGNPEDIPVAEWQRIFDVNLFGAVRAHALVVPKMLARGQGYIVNTASFAGLYPFAVSRVAYAASKAALISLLENLAIHLLPKGIMVSCLCPGPTMTTSVQGMKIWSDDVVMRGPGRFLAVKSQEEVAKILADGMCVGRVLIPTHEEGFDYIRRHADSPDDFIHQKIGEFARGDSGRPLPKRNY